MIGRVFNIVSHVATTARQCTKQHGYLEQVHRKNKVHSEQATPRILGVLPTLPK